MSLRAPLALAAASLVVACAGGSSEPVKPPEAKGSGAPAAGRVAADSPIAGKDEAFGTVRPFAGDDPGKTVPIPGKRAWTLGPGDSWTIGLYDYVRADGTKNVFKNPTGEPDFSIPGAYTLPALPARGLAKGAPVLVPDDTATACGRVVTASDAEIKVALIIDEVKTERTFQPDAVLPLDGKLGFGAPVAYRLQADANAWSLGWHVYNDGVNAWLEGATRAPLAQVKPLDVTRSYRAGDKAFAILPSTDTFAPVTVTKIMDDGLRYEVKAQDGSIKVVDGCGVTPTL